MTAEEALPWKQELVAALQAVVEEFNRERLEDYPEHRIETFDPIRSALGIQLVKARSPSCFVDVDFDLERHPVIVVWCSRRRSHETARETNERYPIISQLNEPLLVEDIPRPLTAADLASTIIRLFPLPSE